jgi:ATP-dependent Clp protease protease subunit
MAAVLLASGARGKRYTLPHSRILIQPSMSGLAGAAADIDITPGKSCGCETLNQILAEVTGHDAEKVARDVDRDYHGCAASLDYGMIDKIIASREAAVVV